MTIMQSSSQQPSTGAKAIIGGGWITTPAVTAHVRQQLAGSEHRALQQAPAGRKALIGGGWITAPAVSSHMQRARGKSGD